MPLRKVSALFRHNCWGARLLASQSRACTQEEAAFEALVDNYRRPLVGFMFRMVHDETVAEELAEEVFLCLQQSGDCVDRRTAEVATWLYRMAARLAMNHGQSLRAGRANAAGQGAPVSHPHDGVTGERVLAIRHHVEALPERQRLALLLHKYQSLDCQQIAEVMGISESATKALLWDAYETLRRKLEQFI